jgi:hypothetical protein
MADFLGGISEEPCQVEPGVFLEDDRIFTADFVKKVELFASELPSDEQIRFRGSMVDMYKMILAHI